MMFPYNEKQWKDYTVEMMMSYWILMWRRWAKPMFELWFDFGVATQTNMSILGRYPFWHEEFGK